MEILLSRLRLSYKAASPIYVNMVGMNGTISLNKLMFDFPFRNDRLDELLVLFKMKATRLLEPSSQSLVRFFLVGIIHAWLMMNLILRMRKPNERNFMTGYSRSMVIPCLFQSPFVNHLISTSLASWMMRHHNSFMLFMKILLTRPEKRFLKLLLLTYSFIPRLYSLMGITTSRQGQRRNFNWNLQLNPLALVVLLYWKYIKY